MREFIYYSSTAPTSGKSIGSDLMKSGRLDIAIHSVIASFFLSHEFREDVKLHLVFDGPPNPPRHLELKPDIHNEKKIYINKSNISDIIKKMLYKAPKSNAEKNEVFPGYFIDNQSLLSLIKSLQKEGKKIFVLDKKGQDIRKAKTSELKKAVFLLGDHQGLPNLKKEFRRISPEKVSIGPLTYFASQTLAILNNELDRREMQ
jgi:tRNA (pseudouridine54-N1)-methyltransferase